MEACLRIMHLIRKAASLLLCAGLPLTVSSAEVQAEGPISQSFELRYFSGNPQANGETDFKGPTAVFTTQDRVEYLKQYSRYARGFFKDPRWDTRIATDAEADAVLAKIKPQPLPSVRRRIPLEHWKCMGSRPGQREQDELRIAGWRQVPGVAVVNGELRFTRKDAEFTKPLPPQHWRMALQWKAKPTDAARRVRFSLLGAAEVGFVGDGRFYWTSAAGEVAGGRYQPGAWTEFKVELDFESGRYNFYAGSELLADFVPLPSTGPFTGLKVEGVEGLRQLGGEVRDVRLDPVQQLVALRAKPLEAVEQPRRPRALDQEAQAPRLGPLRRMARRALNAPAGSPHYPRYRRAGASPRASSPSPRPA